MSKPQLRKVKNLAQRTHDKQSQDSKINITQFQSAFHHMKMPQSSRPQSSPSVTCHVQK